MKPQMPVRPTTAGTGPHRSCWTFTITPSPQRSGSRMAELPNHWLRGPQEEDGDANDEQATNRSQPGASTWPRCAGWLTAAIELGRMPDDLPQVLATGCDCITCRGNA